MKIFVPEMMLIRNANPDVSRRGECEGKESSVGEGHHCSTSDALAVLFRLHLSCAKWPFRAVVRVKTAPHLGHSDFAAVPDFSRWCLRRLLNVENCT